VQVAGVGLGLFPRGEVAASLVFHVFAEAAEALAAFLDTNSLEPLHRYLRDSGLTDVAARSRAAAIAAFVLGVSTRRRVLRSEPGDSAELEAWLGAVIQRLADG